MVGAFGCGVRGAGIFAIGVGGCCADGDWGAVGVMCCELYLDSCCVG